MDPLNEETMDFLTNESDLVSFSNSNSSLLNESVTEPTIEHLPANLIVNILMTLLYASITVVGVLGNIGVCLVVTKNRVMHTATNYYLCSMALSDLLLLVTGMPHELFILWVGQGRPYIFGLVFCVVRGLTAEMSTNASILTIAAFTVERYIGICHPLRSHVMSHLGRVIKFIVCIWLLAFVCALPQAVQYGITPEKDCNILYPLPYTFEISTFLFFIVPMTLITVLYVKIIFELRHSHHLGRCASSIGESTAVYVASNDRSRSVINMLVAVVVAFFVCFAPFHAQRLVAFYGDPNVEIQRNIYSFLTNISGVFFYLSTCINPLLYHILSRRFRQAFKDTLRRCCKSTKCCKCFESSLSETNPVGKFQNGFNRSFCRTATNPKIVIDSTIIQSAMRSTVNNNKNNSTPAEPKTFQRANRSPHSHQSTTMLPSEIPVPETKEQLIHHTWV